MWPNQQLHADLVTFTEEFPNGIPKLHFLCSGTYRTTDDIVVPFTNVGNYTARFGLNHLKLDNKTES